MASVGVILNVFVLSNDVIVVLDVVYFALLWPDNFFTFWLNAWPCKNVVGVFHLAYKVWFDVFVNIVSDVTFTPDVEVAVVYHPSNI